MVRKTASGGAPRKHSMSSRIRSERDSKREIFIENLLTFLTRFPGGTSALTDALCDAAGVPKEDANERKKVATRVASWKSAGLAQTRGEWVTLLSRIAGVGNVKYWWMPGAFTNWSPSSGVKTVTKKDERRAKLKRYLAEVREKLEHIDDLLD